MLCASLIFLRYNCVREINITPDVKVWGRGQEMKTSRKSCVDVYNTSQYVTCHSHVRCCSARRHPATTDTDNYLPTTSSRRGTGLGSSKIIGDCSSMTSSILKTVQWSGSGFKYMMQNLCIYPCLSKTFYTSGSALRITSLVALCLDCLAMYAQIKPWFLINSGLGVKVRLFII